MAWGIGPGDAVICPAFTFCATAEVVALCGATPVMADVDADTFNLDPASCERAVATAKRLGLKPRVIIPVDLFGLPADHDAIAAIAAAHGLLVLDDAAQSFGATYRGRKLGALATATATSFFPAKPLGCYGDGGAVLTDDDGARCAPEKPARARRGRRQIRCRALSASPPGSTPSRRRCCWKSSRYSRMRSPRATRSRSVMRGRSPDVATCRGVGNESTSVWAQYTIRLAPGRRDALAAALKAQGIPTAIYYAKPLHRQAGLSRLSGGGWRLPVSERLAEEVISLPMHAYLEPPVQEQIIAAVRHALTG